MTAKTQQPKVTFTKTGTKAWDIFADGDRVGYIDRTKRNYLVAVQTAAPDIFGKEPSASSPMDFATALTLSEAKDLARLMAFRKLGRHEFRQPIGFCAYLKQEGGDRQDIDIHLNGGYVGSERDMHARVRQHGDSDREFWTFEVSATSGRHQDGFYHAPPRADVTFYLDRDQLRAMKGMLDSIDLDAGTADDPVRADAYVASSYTERRLSAEAGADQQ